MNSSWIKRFLTAAIGASMLFVVLRTEYWGSRFLVMVWTFAIAFEWRKIREEVVKTGTSPFDRFRGSECASWLIIVGTACFHPTYFELLSILIPMLVLAFHMRSLSQMKSRKDVNSILRNAVMSLIFDIFGFIYIPCCISYFVRLSDESLLITMFWASFQCDTGALLAGRAFGRHRVVEFVSPGKTWEGYVGGFCLSAFSVFCLFLIRPYIQEYGFGDAVPSTLSLSDFLVLDFVTVLGTILGDLLESLLKRVARIKDSGSLLPGHGGALDRADALLLTAPLFYYVSKILLQ